MLLFKPNRLKIFRNIPPIYTPRLFMRRILPQDAPDMYEYSSDPSVTRFLTWSPHRDIEYTRRYIESVQRQYRALKFYDWALIVRKTGKMIGTCGFSNINLKENSAEIGYVLNREYWGQEYAVEAASAVIVFGFQKMCFDSICGRYMIENEASKRVMEKCRMIYLESHDEYIESKGGYRKIGVCQITNPLSESEKKQSIEKLF